MKKKISLLLVAVGLLFAASCLAAEPLEVLTPALKSKPTFQFIDEKSLLVSVKDAKNNPIRGLKAEDFVLLSGNKKAMTNFKVIQNVFKILVYISELA